MSMVGEIWKSVSRSGIAAAIAMVIGQAPVQAADLGGDCCADLEERIAELEATTVRKGNRRVSVQLSGWVNQAVMYFDDGVESNTFGVNNGHLVSRFRIKGAAKISSNVTAGYLLELYLLGATSGNVTQDNDDGGGNLIVGQAYWYLNHKQLGQLSVGTRGSATDELALIDLGGARAVAGMDTQNVGGNLYLTIGNIKTSGDNSRVKNIFTSVDIDRGDVVRYDSPTLMGFKISAAWGEDDIWDIALRYAGEFSGIRVAAGVGYYETSDDRGASNVGGSASNDGEGDNRFLGSISVWDYQNTGLYGTGYWNVGEDGGKTRAGVDENRDETRWGIRGGIRKNFFGIGKTNIFADYHKAKVENRFVDVTINTATDTRTSFTGDHEGTVIGGGIIQDIDAASMSLYLRYKQFSFDVRADTGPNAGDKANINDVQILYGGGIIKF